MTPNKKPSTSNKSDQVRVGAGLIILLIGVSLLAPQLGFKELIPSWLFSWPMWLIVIGLIIGGNSNFKNPSALILIGLGVIFLIQREYDFNVWRLVFPAVIIGIGLYLLFYKKETPTMSPPPSRPDYSRVHVAQEEEIPVSPEKESSGAANDTHRQMPPGDYLDDSYFSSTAVFSEEKMIITSRTLQGGEIVNIFGGTDLNLLHADMEGPIVIDLFQLFAGTKIIVPAHWKVHSKVVSIFGEVDDRRLYADGGRNKKHIVYLKGTSIFGGVTIKSM